MNLPKKSDAFSRSIADTSSGAFITSLRWSSSGEGTVSSKVVIKILIRKITGSACGG